MPSYKEQFNLSIFDYSPVGYCVLELVLDDKGQPVDWIYRYCNQAFADIKDHSLEEILDHSFQSLFPEIEINGCMSVMKRHMRTGPVRQTCEKKKTIMWSLHQLEKRVSVQV